MSESDVYEFVGQLFAAYIMGYGAGLVIYYVRKISEYI